MTGLPLPTIILEVVLLIQQKNVLVRTEYELLNIYFICPPMQMCHMIWTKELDLTQKLESYSKN